MRNIRDFKARIRPDSQTLGSASPFNIIADAFTLHNFTEEEIQALYRQHTAETGQRFEDDAVTLVWKETQGQPWLVNAIAREIVEKQLARDYTKPVTASAVARAIQTIILRRDVHIDSLMERLKEDRVRGVIEPLILGAKAGIDKLSDDYQYVRDLGLIRDDCGKTEPANPIYAEVIIRMLSFNYQDSLTNGNYPYQMSRYLKDGRVDMRCLMGDFQQFWRENGAIWSGRFDYKEAAPHLILMAFLQRIINGGGEIIREMAAETGRLDLCVVFEGRRYPIEIKLRYGVKTYTEGTAQLAGYMDALGCKEGWLVVFDRRQSVSWSRKLFMRTKTAADKTITIVGV